MSDRKFTLFELHLHDSSIQFGPTELDVPESMSGDERTPRRLKKAAEERLGRGGEDDEADDASTTTGPKSRFAPILTLVALVVVTVAARRLVATRAD